MERGKPLLPDEIAKAAREKWLKYRGQQAEKGREKGSEEERTQRAERTKDKQRDHTPDDDFSL
jgi:hypothetical protein